MDGKQLVGFVNGMATDEPDLRDEMYDDAALHNENGAWQMIFGVDTIPAYRRRGCAAMLLEHVIAEARRQGRKGLVLTCKDRLVPVSYTHLDVYKRQGQEYAPASCGWGG